MYHKMLIASTRNKLSWYYNPKSHVASVAEVITEG